MKRVWAVLRWKNEAVGISWLRDSIAEKERELAQMREALAARELKAERLYVEAGYAS